MRVRYVTRGVAPNRELVVQYKDVPYKYHSTVFNTFQIILYEDNSIRVNYLKAKSYGEDETVAGIENGDGTIGLQYKPLSNAGYYENFYVYYYKMGVSNLDWDRAQKEYDDVWNAPVGLIIDDWYGNKGHTFEIVKCMKYTFPSGRVYLYPESDIIWIYDTYPAIRKVWTDLYKTD